MDTENLTMEQKCENLMNIVVESRKKFGKMCVDYDYKISLMENKLLNLQLEKNSNCHFKPKYTLPNFDKDENVDDLKYELNEKQKRLQSLLKKVTDTKLVVTQLKNDELGERSKLPLTAEAILARAKNK